MAVAAFVQQIGPYRFKADLTAGAMLGRVWAAAVVAAASATKRATMLIMMMCMRDLHVRKTAEVKK